MDKTREPVSAPNGFWEKAENIFNVITGAKIDWTYRHFKKVLLADNPFLTEAPDEFISQAFDFISFGSSPPREYVCFEGQAIKYSNAIAEIKPDTFEAYHIVKLESLGLSVLDHYSPEMEGGKKEMEAVYKKLTNANASTDHSSILESLRRNKTYSKELEFLTAHANNRAVSTAVIRYLIAREVFAESFYNVQRNDYSFDGSGALVNEGEYEAAVALLQRNQEDASGRLERATDELRRVGIDIALIDGFKLEPYVIEDVVSEIVRELNSKVRQDNKEQVIRSLSSISEQFQLQINGKREVVTKSNDEIKDKGISM